VLSLVREFFGYLREEKKMWLLPLVLMLLIIGVVVTVTSSSVIAPFIYTLF
jgi:hypothetical protein